MKKILSTLLMSFLLFIPFSTINAEVPPSGKIKKEHYSTPDDMMLDFIEPRVDLMIKKEYGEPMSWDWGKITDVRHVMDHTGKESKRWYEVTTMIKVFVPEGKDQAFNLDSMTFSFTPLQSKRDENARPGDLGDINFKLLKYKHIIKDQKWEE
jgi:hypothetical protein